MNETTAPDPVYAAAPTATRPYLALSIVGLVLACIGFLNIAGLVISIIAFVKSRKLGQKNGIALAGIIVSAITIAFCALCLALILPGVIDLFQACGRLGLGTHVVGNTTYVCTPTGSSEFTTW